ncbi:hypothetical protein N9F34_01255 [Alphaproteobacteria bacterium]|nr:hypothetical protein [Alphaproteobacteria bacterium]
MLLPSIDFNNHPAYAALALDISSDERAAAVNQYDGNLAQARKSLAPFSKVWQSPGRQPAPNASPIFEGLVCDGIVGLTPPTALRALADEVSAPFIARLRAQITASTQELSSAAQIRFSYDELRRSNVGRLVAKILGYFELMPIVSAYLGMEKVAVKAVHFKITDNVVSQDRGTLDVFQDPSMPDPDTRYFHVDAPPCDLKLILYLSDVLDISQGPFSYVVGSHAGPYITLEEFAVRAATQAFAPGRSAEERRKLMCIPGIYRQRIDFGSDLLDGSPIARDLLERERVFYSNVTEMLLFDSKGIHRGAMVTRGTRRVMQVTFQGVV